MTNLSYNKKAQFSITSLPWQGGAQTLLSASVPEREIRFLSKYKLDLRLSF
jgi:hypothetical protein